MQTHAATPAAPTIDELRSVSPALARYTQEKLLGELWTRPGLTPRDRSLVTLSALIAKNQLVELPFQLRLALQNGVQPAEISELITQLAFYAGWANATGAAAIAKEVFAERGVTAEELPPASPALLALDETAEAARAAHVEQSFGKVAPGVVRYTADLLFRELWLRPGLTPRDRSLVTVCALIANGQVAQLTYHLSRAMDRGLTAAETSEVLTQLAFYAGWPSVFSALPVVTELLAKRPREP